MKEMTFDKLFAIMQVTLVNRDIVELLEKRGVSVEDMQAVFQLAQVGLQKKTR